MKKTHTVRTFLASIPSALLKLANAKIPALPAVLAVVLVLGLMGGANAANNKKQIAAYEDYTIAIKLDGEVQTPVNANGTRVYPITYNGTTYLPVRAVAGMAGLAVDWDQATQTVLLGSKPANGVDLIDTYKFYYNTGWPVNVEQKQTVDNKTRTISGIDCTHWFYFNISANEYNGLASFNLQGKHDTLTFKYYSKLDCTLRVLGDNGAVLFEKEVKGGQVAQTAAGIQLLHCNEMSFQVSGSNGYTNDIFIFDAYLDAE